MARSEAVAAPAGADFVIRRVFDAPRALVFKAWTDPKHMAQWWGPHGCTVPVCELDARPGGAWRLVNRGPDGDDFPVKGVFREVVENERIVMTIDHSEMPDSWHDWLNPGRDRSKGKPTAAALITVTFEERGGKTTVTVRQRFESPEFRDGLVKMGLGEGWTQSLERLADELARASTGKGWTGRAVTLTLPSDRQTVLTRVFDAPRELVFKANIDPKLIPRWWGPRYLTTTVDKLDARPGGSWRFLQRGPDGKQFDFHGEFREVVPPERLVYTFELEAMPGTVRGITTVTFEDLGGKTKFTHRSVFDTVDERDWLVDAGMEVGSAESYERLDEVLAATA